MRRRVIIGVVAGVLCVGIAAYVLFAMPTTPSERRAHDVAGAASEAPDERSAVELSPASERASPSGAATAPDQPTPSDRIAADIVSACDEVEGEPAFDRPTIYELVSVRAQELDDRVRHAQRRSDTSPALREGLLAALDPSEREHALALLRSAPDRRVDGFDHLAAVASVMAWQALTSGDRRRALGLARDAERDAPTDALPFLIDALATEADEDLPSARRALGEAFRLEPGEPAVALAYFLRLRDTVELDAALRAADAYLAEVPADAQVARIRERIRLRRAAMGDSELRQLRGISLVSPRGVDQAVRDRGLDVADRGLTDAARLIGAPRKAELSMFVYATHSQMLEATCGQQWTAALYDGALHVDAERLASASGTVTSLRHEALHAALHEVVPGARNDGTPLLPTWFDEGVAQYFADEESHGARHSFERMVRDRTFVPLASMNGRFMVIDDPADAGLAYHQALAMVLYLVSRRGERGIAEAVRYLRDGGDPDALLEGVRAPLDGESMLVFLEQHLETPLRR